MDCGLTCVPFGRSLRRSKTCSTWALVFGCSWGKSTNGLGVVGKATMPFGERAMLPVVFSGIAKAAPGSGRTLQVTVGVPLGVGFVPLPSFDAFSSFLPASFLFWKAQT